MRPRCTPTPWPLFVTAAREYLREPRMEFFFPNARRPMTRDELRAAADRHGSRLVSVTFDRPEAIEDNLHSQLWKTQTAIGRKLEEQGFSVLRAVHEMDEASMTAVFELEDDVLPRTRRHRGPPAWVNSDSFMAKWKGSEYGDPFIEDGYWTVVAPRQYTSACEMVRMEAERSGIGKELDLGTMRVLGHEETLAEADAGLLTSLLDPKMPWEC